MFTGRMLFMMPNQQCQSTEGTCNTQGLEINVTAAGQVVTRSNATCYVVPAHSTIISRFVAASSDVAGTS